MPGLCHTGRSVKSKYTRYELAFYLILAVLCAVYGVFSLQMPMGKLSNPAQGFFPALMSVIGLGLSLLCAWGPLRKLRRPAADEEKPGVDFTGRSGLLTVALYIGMILFFILFAGVLGSYVCVFLLVLVLCKAQGLPGAIKPLLLAACSAAAFYLTFGRFLGVMLPSGLLI